MADNERLFSLKTALDHEVESYKNKLWEVERVHEKKVKELIEEKEKVVKKQVRLLIVNF